MSDNPSEQSHRQGMALHTSSVISLQPARLFLNREHVLSGVERRLRAVDHQVPVDRPVINIWGGPGIGKTALLAHLQSRYRDDRRLTLICLSLPQQAMDWRAHIEHALTQEVRPLGTPWVGAHPGRLPLEEIVEICNAASQSRALLFLCDGWEYIDRNVARVVSQELLKPLLKSGKLIAVVGSQRRFENWGALHFLHRVEYVELSGLDQSSSTRQIFPTTAPDAAILGLTRGYPLANEIAFYELQSGLPVSDVEHAILSKTVAELRRRSSSLIDDLHWEAFSVLAVLRRFQHELARAVFDAFLPQLAHCTLTEVLGITQRLSQHSLCYPQDPACREFHLVPHNLHRIVAAEMHRRAPELAAGIHRLAAAHYEQILSRVKGSVAGAYLVECCYHLLAAGDVAAADLSERFERMLRRLYYSPDLQAVSAEGLEHLEQLMVSDPHLPLTLQEFGLAPWTLVDVVRRHRGATQ